MIALETPALHDYFSRLAPPVYHAEALNINKGSKGKVGEQPHQAIGW